MLWPLLIVGAPRTLLLGKLVVLLGIDSATANRRLSLILAQLAASSAIEDVVGSAVPSSAAV